ncbi:SRPBCC family protein, partial [bacterium]|nr:SRPBCC family protein [bacterium]
AEVHPDGDGVSGVVRGAVEIAASPDTVWRTITDCGRAGRMAPSVKSCRITVRDPGGRWDIREMIVRSGLMPSFRTEFRSEFTPLRSIRFRCTAGDIR